MSQIAAIAIACGLCTGLWVEISSFVGISTWVGFAGCCSFFAVGGGRGGAVKSLLGNMTGVAWAMIAFLGSELLNMPRSATVMAVFISTMMCYQSKYSEHLSFIPSAFFGCFVTYGLNGDWRMAVIGLLSGLIFGVVSEQFGDLLFKVLNHKGPLLKRLRAVNSNK